MVAIAWAIVISAIIFSDAVYTLKFGKDHLGSKTSKNMTTFFVISFWLCVISSIIGLAK